VSEGELRRPPLLWEQRLQALIPNVGVQGASDSVVINDPAPGPGGPSEEPAEPPVLDEDPSTPRDPAAPTVTGGIGGLVVFWSGTDDDNLAYPPGVYVEVHVSTTSGFTPSSATLVGTILGAGRLDVTGLTSGTTYYVRLVTVLLDGTKLDPTAQVSAVAGFVLAGNIGTGEIGVGLINFDATEIGGIQQFVGTATPAVTGSGTAQRPVDGSTWINTGNGSYYTLAGGSWIQRQWGGTAIAAGAISALQIATGAITAESAIIAAAAIGSAQIQDANITDAKIVSLTANKLTAGTIDASQITVTNLNASNITSGTITGRTFQTSTSGSRIVITDGTASTPDTLQFYGGNTLIASLAAVNSVRDYLLCTNNLDVVGTVTSDRMEAGQFVGEADLIVGNLYRPTTTTTAPIFRLRSDVTTAGQDKFEVQADGDVLSRTNSYAGFSDARYKENIRAARRYLEDLRQVEVVKFNWIDDPETHLGVTAQQVQNIFPGLVDETDDGTLYVKTSVFIPMLITAVQELADKVDALTARIEALED
jgi:hypothetical protein